MKKRFLACLLTVCMLVAMLPTMAFAGNVTYVDLGGHWCEEPIYKWTEYGVVNGVGKDANGGDLFDPDGLLTREQAAAIFARLLKLEKTADVSFFKDVAAGQWYVDGIAKCYAAGIIKGTGIDTFGTGAYLTRADMFTMFCRALGIEEQDACDKVFDDVREVPVYAKEYTNALVNLGYVDGVTATTLQPLANITRAQMVALLDKAIVGYITEDGEYEINEDGIVLVVGEGLDVALSGKGAISAVVTGDDTEIDVTEMDNAEDVVIVVKGANNVKAKASAGTTVVTMDAEDATVNGEDLDEVDEIVVEEEKKPASSGSSSSDRNDRCTHRYAYETDAEGHREYCYKCDEWTDAWEAHEFGDDSVCDICGYGCEHKFGDLIVDRLPTCEEMGSEHIECEYCGAKRGNNTAALGHDWVRDEVVAPTCKEDGYTVYVCANDSDHTKNDDVIEAGKDHCVDENEDKLCDLCGKFYAGISTETEDSGAVEVTVDDEYVATLKVTEGSLNAQEVNVSIAMNDVESLGGGVKSYDKTVSIESMPKDVDSLAYWLPAIYGVEGSMENGVEGSMEKYSGSDVYVTLIDADGEEYETYYEVSEAVIDEETGDAVITATPDENVSDVWHAMINDATVETSRNNGDSYVLINNTSYLQVGGQKLEFTDNAEDLVLDNFDELADMKAQIQDSVVLKKVKDEDAVILYAGAGCELAVGESKATLLQNTKVTITGAKISDELLTELQELAQGSDYTQMALGAVGLVNELIAATDGAKIEVLIEMTEAAEVTTKVEAEITTATGTGSVYAEVLSDYSATMIIDGGELEPHSVTVSLEMTDIDSLGVDGTKSHTDTVTIESFPEGATVKLKTFLPAVFGGVMGEDEDAVTPFSGATIVATCDDNQVVYEVESNVDDGIAVVTAVPTSERAARAMWHSMLNGTVEVGENDADSSILIAGGSYLQVGGEKLIAVSDLTLDNFEELTAMKDAILEAVKLDTNAGGEIVLYAAEGCMLDISGSYAELKKAVKITITGADVEAGVLSALRAAISEGAVDSSAVYEMTFAALELLNKMILGIDGEPIYVDIIIG